MKFVVSMAFSDPGHYCELARAADASGWDGIAVSDHVVHPEKIHSPYPYTDDGAVRWEDSTSWPDPWIAISAMAAVTERIRFLTHVFVLPMRSPFLVAKAVGTAAAMSGNRIALGIGVGWMKDEFELVGRDFHTRGRRADEMIEVMRKLWSGEMVEHHGRFYDFDRLRMLPAPTQPIPLYVGGVSEPALRRAARMGDGWLSDLHTSEELRAIVEKLRSYREEYGRAQQPFDVIAACSDASGTDGYRRLEDLGVTHVLTLPWAFYGGSAGGLDAKRDGNRRFADDVIVKLR